MISFWTVDRPVFYCISLLGSWRGGIRGPTTTQRFQCLVLGNIARVLHKTKCNERRDDVPRGHLLVRDGRESRSGDGYSSLSCRYNRRRRGRGRDRRTGGGRGGGPGASGSWHLLVRVVVVDRVSIPVVAEELSLYAQRNVLHSVVCVYRLRCHVCQGLGRPNLHQPLRGELSKNGILGLDPKAPQAVSIHAMHDLTMGLSLPLYRRAELMSRITSCQIAGVEAVEGMIPSLGWNGATYARSSVRRIWVS